MKRQTLRCILYYKHGGLKELLSIFLLIVLWYPRHCYRLIMWWIIRRINKKPLVKRIHGMVLHLNPNDHGLSMDLAVEKIHEPVLLNLLCSTIKNGMTVIDIGANIGYYTILESYIVGNKGKVIAFEPVPTSFAYLKRNMEINKRHNIYAKNVAIGDREGMETMFIFSKANQNSLIAYGRKFTSTIDVKVRTLDGLIEKESKIDIIRMDIEGYECKVISGMTKILKEHKPMIFLELHVSFTPLKEIFAFLKNIHAMGYNIKWAFPRIKDEVFMGRILFRKKTVPERLSLEDLLADPRLTRCRETFSIIFEFEKVS